MINPDVKQRITALRRERSSPMCDFWHRVKVGGFIAAVIAVVHYLHPY